MNAFDLNRKEYIRVYNSDGGELTQFKKVTFLTSFVISGEDGHLLPTSYDAINVNKANQYLFLNASSFCSLQYPDSNGYACYISEVNVLNIGDRENLPYAKVNVYLMDGRPEVVV